MSALDDLLPTAAENMKAIALAEAEKASAAVRQRAAADAEKMPCWSDWQSHPVFRTKSGLSVPQPSSNVLLTMDLQKSLSVASRMHFLRIMAGQLISKSRVGKLRLPVCQRNCFNSGIRT